MAARGVRIWAIAGLALAGSCAAPHPPAPPPKPAGPAPLAIAPPPALIVPPPPKDACGAADLQYLIGKPRTEIPVPLAPGQRRVACSTCPVTEDYVSYRQTIIYDSDTGLIVSVKCG
jgi:hypothetical protein